MVKRCFLRSGVLPFLLLLLLANGCGEPAGSVQEITTPGADRAEPISLLPGLPELDPREPGFIAAAETTIAAAALRTTLLRQSGWKTVRLSPDSGAETGTLAAITRKAGPDGHLKLSLKLTDVISGKAVSHLYTYPYTVIDPGPFERFGRDAATALAGFRDTLESGPAAPDAEPITDRGDRASHDKAYEILLLDTISRFAAVFAQDFRGPLLDWRRTGHPPLEMLLELEERLRCREIIGTAAIVRSLIIAAGPIQADLPSPPALAALLEHGAQPLPPAVSSSSPSVLSESPKPAGILRETSLRLEVDNQVIHYRGRPEELYRSWRLLVRQLPNG